jgi:hypothetical protein
MICIVMVNATWYHDGQCHLINGCEPCKPINARLFSYGDCESVTVTRDAAVMAWLFQRSKFKRKLDESWAWRLWLSLWSIYWNTGIPGLATRVTSRVTECIFLSILQSHRRVFLPQGLQPSPGQGRSMWNWIIVGLGSEPESKSTIAPQCPSPSCLHCVNAGSSSVATGHCAGPSLGVSHLELGFRVRVTVTAGSQCSHSDCLTRTQRQSRQQEGW